MVMDEHKRVEQIIDNMVREASSCMSGEFVLPRDIAAYIYEMAIAPTLDAQAKAHEAEVAEMRSHIEALEFSVEGANNRTDAWSSRCLQAERERDEARAEVKALQRVADAARGLGYPDVSGYSMARATWMLARHMPSTEVIASLHFALEALKSEE